MIVTFSNRQWLTYVKRWEHEKCTNACSHTNGEVKTNKIKNDKMICFRVLFVTFINDAGGCVHINIKITICLDALRIAKRATKTTSRRCFWSLDLKLKFALFAHILTYVFLGVRSTKTT